MVAVPLGVIGAWKAGKFIDRLVMLFSVLGFSIPVFVLAYLLIYVFAIQLDWLPGAGLCADPRGLLALAAAI